MKNLQKILLLLFLLIVTDTAGFGFGFGFGFKAGSKNNESIGKGVGNGALFSLGPWHINNINGNIIFQGQYQSKEVTLQGGFSDEPVISTLTGNLNLSSNSVVWHPKFMTIDLDANYNPNALRQTYNINPNFSQSITAESFRARVSFLNRLPVNLVLTSAFGHGYTSRENFTDFESYSRSHGASFQFRNSILPISVSANTSRWEENELQTSRNSYNDRLNYSISTKKQFGRYDKTTLSYTYEDFSRRLMVEPVGLRNKITRVLFDNSVFFDSTNASYLMSHVNFIDSKGSYETKGISAFERLSIELPEGFSISTDYQFTRDENYGNIDKRNQISGQINHQLYKSLNTFVSYLVQNVDNTGYDELGNTFRAGFNYNKLIPTGVLRLNYSFSQLEADRTTNDKIRIYRKEEHVLDDSGIELLDNPYVDISSVRVFDSTLTIVYTPDIDYRLFPRGEFLEIQRIPGGMISEGQTVFVDYESTRNLPYAFSSTIHNFGGSILLFDRLFEVYYIGVETGFSDIVNPEARVLQEISQSTYGLKINYNDISGGAEIDNMVSNIIPYYSTRYYITYFDNLANQISFSLNAAYKDTKLTASNESYQSGSITAGMDFELGNNANAMINSGYVYQQWIDRGFNVFITRGEISYKYLQVFLTLGVQYFDRDYYTERVNFQDVFLRIERRF